MLRLATILRSPPRRRLAARSQWVRGLTAAAARARSASGEDRGPSGTANRLSLLSYRIRHLGGTRPPAAGRVIWGGVAAASRRLSRSGDNHGPCHGACGTALQPTSPKSLKLARSTGRLGWIIHSP